MLQNELFEKIIEGISLFRGDNIKREEIERYLNSVVHFLPAPNKTERHDILSSSLQQSMRETRDSVDNQSALDRLKLGLDYRARKMWRDLRAAGIYGVCNVNICYKRFHAKLSVHITTEKHDNETTECFYKRRDDFLASTPFDIVLAKNSNQYHVANTPHDTEILIEYIEKACGIIIDNERVSMNVRNGYIRDIEFFYSYAEELPVVSAESEEVKELNIQAFSEKSLKYLLDIKSGLDIMQEIPEMKETMYAIIGSIFFMMFEDMGISNEWRIMYEKDICPERRNNLYTKQKAEEIGSSIPAKELILTFDSLRVSIDKFFASNYRMVITSMEWTNGGLCLELSVNVLNAKMVAKAKKNLEIDKYLFDIDDMFNRVIPVKHLDDIYKIMALIFDRIEISLHQMYAGAAYGEILVINKINAICKHRFLESIFQPERQ